MNLQEHYKAVRARLHAGRPPPPEPDRPPPEPDRPPPVDLGPLMREAHDLADTPIGPRWKYVLRDVAKRHNLTIDQLIGPRRHKHLVTARFEAYHLLRQHGYSLTQIGERMHRDHTTVLHGMTKPFNPMTRRGDL
jgi:hypothetical protein